MKAQLFTEILKAQQNKWCLFVGLTVSGVDELAMEGGEDPKEFHVTLLYGYFNPNGGDEDDIGVRIQSAREAIKDQIPEKLVFDSIGRFEASESSDGKDVIYANVKEGQLEDLHEAFLKALKEEGLKVEKTFEEYHPHMTLAYVDPEEEYDLPEIDATATITGIKEGFGEESTHENEKIIKKSDKTQNFNIMKTVDDKRLIFGWASVAIKVDGEQVVDYQNDLIDPEDLEESVYEYVLNFRDSGEEHISTLRKKGRLVESCMFTKEKMAAMGIPEGIVPEAWWIGFYIDDDDAWEKVKNGTYQMFSIEGQGIREEVEDEVTKSDDDFAKTSHDFEDYEKPEIIELERVTSNRSTEKRPAVAKSFEEILKFNPFHDSHGRFASSNGFASYSANPKTKAGAMAISRSAQAGHGTTFNSHKESQGENINQNYAWLNGGPGAKQLSSQGQLASQQPKQPPKPKKNYDKLGFADQDDADFHQLYNGRQYYQQQKLTAKQKQAATNYLEAHTEPGSLYSHSQNMNTMMAKGQKLTGKYKQTHDGLMSAMHNIGYNVTLTRYDHDGMINSLLNTLGAGKNYENLTQKQLQKALVGVKVNENKFLSTSYNDFTTAPASSKKIFDSRAVKINYKVKADTKAMMPGKGPGGDFGEIILAPTNGTANRGGTITGVRLTGQKVRRKGTQTYDQPRIEIDIEI